MDSAVNGLIDESAVGLVGFSFGGGGAICAANQLGDRVQATFGIAPFIVPELWDLSQLTAPTLIVSGAQDETSIPDMVRGIYQSLPQLTDKAFVLFNDSTHIDGVVFGSNKNKYETYITSWLKVYLSGDDSFQTYINGENHQARVDQGWFAEFMISAGD
jgi:cephalosporin-C deacetylase-like acetyl esterase